VIFSILGATLGIPMAVGDEDAVNNPQVQVVGIASKGPAQIAGLETGDIVLGVTKVSEVQELGKKTQQLIQTM
ncbi:MAG: hypothetical protein UU19_C0035G0012, partial [Candidatus Curtissbacteria bacterium GW2011_GWD1_40_8]